MYLWKLKELFIPSDFEKQSYYDYVYRARGINEIIEEAILKNKEKYEVYDAEDISPVIVDIQDIFYKNKNNPLISLLYHFPITAIILKIYKDRVIVIKSDEEKTIEFKNGEYEKLKNIF